MLARSMLRNFGLRAGVRFYSDGTGQNQGTSSVTSPSPATAKMVSNVPGLSSAVIHPASEPLGPGVDPQKSGPYKVPEYFCYDNMSYFEAEIEMSKFRLPQPSSLKQ
ncbi:uncharacterized protein LOC120631510 [Pararge aegeria]|uniref:Jg1735 protein n=2 Tax=Pararge aegeria TaxID=116150 RepID=A0A8S4SPS5_9NEOP|nr:uncharacterized protein LOC120631510 [Pararge aegeria]CAH2269215.1 jg1735 [Pararge aegeria aegeria]